MSSDQTQLRFLPCGDSAVTVEFSKEMSEDVNRQIRYVAAALAEGGVKGISECVPTFILIKSVVHVVRQMGLRISSSEYVSHI